MRNLTSIILVIAGFFFLICENNPLDGTGDEMGKFFVLKIIGAFLCFVGYLIGSSNERKTQSRHSK